MAIQEITSPPMLDSTGQTMVTKLQSIASAINSNAGAISYDNTISGMTATKVQSAIDEVKGITDTISSSLAQLFDTVDFGTTTQLTVAVDGTYTATSMGVITGYFRKTANSNMGNAFITSNKCTTNDKYRFLASSTINGCYIPVNFVVVKGETIKFTNLDEINLSGSVIKFMPFTL